MSTTDIVIIGGGVIGLTTAYTLAKNGATVQVIDSNEPGQASKHSAGMLAPLGESHESSPFVPLAIQALRKWTPFVERLSEDLATPLKINGPGMLRIALDDEEEEDLIRTFNWQISLGLPLKMLCPDELRDLEPGLTKEVRQAILTPMELYVEPQIVMDALNEACNKIGVKIHKNTGATGFITAGAAVEGVRTTRDTYCGAKYLVAGGSWSGILLQTLGYSLPVRPVRGQIVAYGPVSPSPLRYTIYSHRGYLVPRSDGRILAGATEEYAGYDYSNTPEGIEKLTSMASFLLPALDTVTARNPWAGLRPISDDKMALIGPVPGWQNLHLATGHGRNGVLLAPLTGELVANALLLGAPIPSTFDPLRFGDGR
jgi:glycine oxidase